MEGDVGMDWTEGNVETNWSCMSRSYTGANGWLVGGCKGGRNSLGLGISCWIWPGFPP